MRNPLIILLISLVQFSYSQDQLFKKDNSKIEAKILEINQTEIKYKLFNYQDGPTIIISKNDVAMIIYQNGTHEVFNNKTEPVIQTQNNTYDTKRYEEAEKKREDEKLAKFNELVSTKNLVCMNLLEPMNGVFSINYLRELGNNLFNIYVPFGVGFTEPYLNQMFISSYYYGGGTYNNSYITNFKLLRKSIDAGIGLHFQTSGKRAVTHFIGPYFGISQYTGEFDEVYYTNSYNYDPSNNYTVKHGFVMNRYQILLDNGFLFRASKNFNVILIGGVGYRVDDFLANNPNTYTGTQYNYRYNSGFPFNAFKLGLSMGYRF
jgi:hypothetical protein